MRAVRGKVSQSYSLPAPVGGLNARDAIADMAPQYATIMQNWFPSSTSVNIRNGCNAYATSFPADVNTIATYRGSSNEQIFACSGANIYNITALPYGAPVVTGLTSSKFQFCQMGTIGGRFLLMFNGSDNAQYYDGTTWTSVSLGGGPGQISGIDPKKIINCNVFKSRLFLVEQLSANVWYFPINSIYGAALKLDFSSLLSRGGNIIAMATWSVDESDGMQEYAVFISENGEILIYKGSDPSVATDWAIVSRFYIGRPIGYRCFTKFGSDLVVLCTDGVIPLTKALTSDRSQAQLAITDKISSLITSGFNQAASSFGWQIFLHPTGKKLIVNIPISNGLSSIQYVMNTVTGAWCKFKGWNALCFELFNDQLFYGSKNTVYKADVGNNDNGSAIIADCQQAFNYFGTARKKLFTAMRTIISVDGPSNILYSPNITINTDFEQTIPTNTSTFMSGNTSPWNTSPWNTSPWSSSMYISKDWQTIYGLGFTGAPRIVISSLVGVSWQSTDIVYQVGEYI